MELKKGYKQTELGVIPDDWEIKLISECSLRITDGEHLTPTRTESGYYLLSARNILNGKIDTTDVDYVGKEEYFRIRKRCNPEYGDVLISCSGSIGRVATVPKDFECVMVRSAALIKPNYSKANGQYIQYFLQSSIGQNQIFASMNQGAQPNLFLNHIQNLRIVLPTTKAEQTAIATALSDIDDLINSLSTLIEKKKAIKQGAMQQLLKPKEGWVVKKLGEVGNCYAGGTPSTFISAYWSGNIVWLPSGRVQNNILVKQENEITITELGLKESAAKLIKVNSVLIAITGATCGNIGLLQFEAAANQSVVAIEPFDKYDYKYLYYLLLTIRGVILSNQTGSAQGGVNLKTIKNIEVELPEDEKEQIKISTILYDMDNEIQSLEQNLSKFQLLKQGMMQELLTGKIRLV